MGMGIECKTASGCHGGHVPPTDERPDDPVAKSEEQAPPPAAEVVDARAPVMRLPTIVVRPGKPNKAASTFASSIIREPLAGLEAVCPVERDAVFNRADRRQRMAAPGFRIAPAQRFFIAFQEQHLHCRSSVRRQSLAQLRKRVG